MVIAAFVLASMGLLLGFSLAYAAKVFHVASNPIVEEVEQMLPGTQCGQCGFAGCSAAASAIVDKQAEVTCCPPGGASLAKKLAEKLGIAIDLEGISQIPAYASINEDLCTGCTRCYKVCPTDAILGANKQIHSVIRKACTGCGACEKACPENCISLTPDVININTWQWPFPLPSSSNG